MISSSKLMLDGEADFDDENVYMDKTINVELQREESYVGVRGETT